MAESKESKAYFEAVHASQFVKYVNELDKLGPSEYESYNFQLMVLNQMELPKLHQVTDVTKVKNRYVNVIPSEQHRVRLSPNQYGCDYINANYIKSTLPNAKTTYIATQAPIPESILDFWKMIWEQRVSLIVMLTNEKENGKVKAHKYWPNCREEAKFGEFTVSGKNEDTTYRSLIIRTFDIQMGNETKEVCHIQYTAWPDHDIPRDFSGVYRLFAICRSKRAQTPIVIHCSAGLGRTGSYALIDTVLDNLSADHTPDPLVHVFDALKEIRTFRPGSIQTAEQYKFVFHFLKYCIEKQLFGIKIQTNKK